MHSAYELRVPDGATRAPTDLVVETRAYVHSTVIGTSVEFSTLRRLSFAAITTATK